MTQADVLRGDVAVEVGGETYTFRYSGAAFMAIEEAFGGEHFAKVLQRFAPGPGETTASVAIGDVARVVRAGLRRHHPNLTLDDAADLVMVPEIQAGMSRALAAAMPPASAGGDGDAEADPPKRRRGTGTTR